MKKITLLIFMFILLSSIVLAITSFRPKTDIDLQTRYNIFDAIGFNSTNNTFFFNQNGRVGINTSNPSHALNIVGAVNITDNILAQNVTFNNIFTNSTTIANPTNETALEVIPRRTTSTSTSVGGAILLTNTQNYGAGFIIYSNLGTGASGRLMNIRADNENFSQAALNIDYDGTADAFTIIARQNNSVGMSAADISSTNRNHTSLGVSGYERSHGTIKVDHKHDSSIDDSDADAAAISINLDGNGTQAQGFYQYSDGNTSGNLISLNNNGVRPFYVDYRGSLFMRFGANITTSRINASFINASDLTIINNIWVNGKKICLDDGTNCNVSAAEIVWTNSSTETSIRTGYPNNITIRGKINLTDTTINADDAAFSIIVGSSATNFVDFWVAGTQTLKFGRELNIAGFFTPNPGDRMAFGTAGLVNVLDINGNTRTIQLQAQNRLRLDTVNSSGNVTVAAKRLILPTGNRTEPPLCFGAAICNDGMFDGSNTLTFVINDLDVGNITANGVIVNHNETYPSRSFNTQVQNGARAKLIYGSIGFNTTSLTDKSYVSIYTGSEPPTRLVQEIGIYNNVANESISFSFTVQPNAFYRMNLTTTGGGSAYIKTWNEDDF